MSETNESPPPDEQPPAPAPRPGMRLAAPGAVPALPAPPAAEAGESPPAQPEPQPEPEAPKAAGKMKRTRAPRKAAGRGSATGSGPGSPEPPTTGETSSTTSSDGPQPGVRSEPAPVFVENDQLRTDLRELLLTASAAANDRYAPRETPMFLATENEADGVARPLARVVLRHTPAGLGGPGNPDLGDAVSAGITLVRYLGRQIRLWFEIKRRQAGGTSPGDQDTEAA